MLAWKCPIHSHWKWVWAQNDNAVNLKSASFVVIMLWLLYSHKKKKPRLHFGESFTLTQNWKYSHFPLTPLPMESPSG